MGIYHIVIWFFLCSLLGYLLECVVLIWSWSVLYYLRIWSIRSKYLTKAGVRQLCRTLSGFHDHGDIDGIIYSFCDDPSVWELLVGLQ